MKELVNIKTNSTTLYLLRKIIMRIEWKKIERKKNYKILLHCDMLFTLW